MRPIGKLSLVAVVGTALALGGGARSAQPEPRLLADGTLEMSGKKLRCADVETRLDRRLPNLGAASPHEGMLWINPRLLADETPLVRLFVFHHECGHHHVGASELGSDCWAVERGVEAGWLSKAGLKEVCESFGDAAESATHPSAQRRCANLDRCHSAALKKRGQPTVDLAAARSGGSEARRGADDTQEPIVGPRRQVVDAVARTAATPKLVRAPRLLWTGEVQ